MKKYIKAILLVVVFSFIKVDAADYKYNKVTMNFKVREDNIIEVEEILSVNFLSDYKHGIIRSIPYQSTILRESKNYNQRNKVIVKGVNNIYKVLNQNGSIQIRIGDPNSYASRHEIYKIEYDILLGNDGSKEFDEIYYNIIGTDFDTTMDEVYFRIEMPKSFDKEKLGFSLGYRGSSGYNPDLIEYQVDGNVITGRTTQMLPAYNALTVRLELPEGYFKTRGMESKYAILVILITTFIFYITFVNANKGEKPVVTVEFYPPFVASAPEIASFIKRVSYKDMNSILFQLAADSYISISDKPEDLANKKDIYVVKKLKPYDQDNKYIKKFYNELFKNGDMITGRSIGNSERFYSKYSEMSYDIQKETNIKKYPKGHTKNKIIAGIICIIIVFLNYLFITNDLVFIYEVLVATSIGAIGLVIFSSYDEKKFIPNLILLVLSIFVIGIADGALNSMGLLLMPSIPLYILLILILLFKGKATKYKPAAKLTIGKILGFKNFLVKAEKSKLEKLVADDPNYFMNILPYTMALGVSKVWVKKFQQFNIPMSSGNVSTHDLMYLSNRTSRSFSTSAATFSSNHYSSSSGGGSGFSGGGFSGGGSGGGGSSSW